MAKSIRSFSLSLEAQLRLEKFLPRARAFLPELQALNPQTPVSPPVLDELGLLPAEDYPAICAAVGCLVPNPLTSEEFRCATAMHGNSQPAGYARRLNAAVRAQAQIRRQALLAQKRQAARQPRLVWGAGVNVSLVVEALLNYAINQLDERNGDEVAK